MEIVFRGRRSGKLSTLAIVLVLVVVMSSFANAFRWLQHSHSYSTQLPFLTMPLSRRGVRSAVSRIPANISRNKPTVDTKKKTSSKPNSLPSNIIILENQKNLDLKEIDSLFSKSRRISNKPSEDSLVPKSRTRKSTLVQKLIEERKALFDAAPKPEVAQNKIDPREIPLAKVTIKNTQQKFPINFARVQEDLDIIRTILNVRDYEVDVWFCSHIKIRQLNDEFRDKSKATDILSFPITEFSPPEVLAENIFNNTGKLLGDMVICPYYIHHRCVQDLAAKQKRELKEQEAKVEEAKQETQKTKTSKAKAKSKSSTMEYEDGGISLAMSSVFTLEERLPLLLIHGLLHLLGHDHEKRKDWVLMTRREEEVLALYRQAINEKNQNRLNI